MALTKVSRGLLTTSIVDNGNATAITIGSDESTTFSNPIILTAGALAAAGNAGLSHRSADNRVYLQAGTGGFNILDDQQNTHLSIDSAGRVTTPLQPAFLAMAVAQNNIPIAGSSTVNFSSKVFDLGSDYSGAVFTAPVAGKYQLNLSLYVLAIDSAADYVQISMNTSNRQYYAIVDPGVWTGDPTYWSFAITVLADMDASDTAHVEVQLNNSGAAQMDITANSAFSGYLVA